MPEREKWNAAGFNSITLKANILFIQLKLVYLSGGKPEEEEKDVFVREKKSLASAHTFKLCRVIIMNSTNSNIDKCKIKSWANNVAAMGDGVFPLLFGLLSTLKHFS